MGKPQQENGEASNGTQQNPFESYEISEHVRRREMRRGAGATINEVQKFGFSDQPGLELLMNHVTVIRRLSGVRQTAPQFAAGVLVKLAWHFSKVNPRFKNREATQGEFFANDTELRAFIREAVQNSLDAKRPNLNGPVSVRIFLSGTSGALEPEAAKRYFKNDWDHFHADGSGLREPPGRDEKCSFITYEDSGTTGLTGDTEQYHEVAGVRNPFYYFFRAEGQSNKQESGRGRWGLGKFVFPRSSRIRSFFGVTVRQDDRRRLLVGQSILRSHHIAEKSYTPDGWFGIKPEKDEAAPPVDDQDFIDQFEEDFCLERKQDPGLSIVVPFCDETWTADAVIESFLQDYFYVILREELVVTVEDADAQTVLNSQSLPSILAQVREPVRTTISSLLTLTEWALTQQSLGSLITLQSTVGKGLPKWSHSWIDAEMFDALRRAFHDQGRVALRVPVSVQHRHGTVRGTRFDIFLERSEGSQQKRPMFIRDGIIISDVRSRLIRDVHAIVVIEEPLLTEFLGDAENPAHTEWHEESSHFKGKYVNGAATLRFIRNSVADVCQMLAEAVEDQDSELLLDVFSVGTAPNQAGWPVDFASMTTSGSVGSNQRLRALKGKSPRSRPWRLSRCEGGFRISGRQSSDELNNGIEVLVAYDRRSGSPLRKYSVTDFRLDAKPLQIETTGARTEIAGPNRLVVYAIEERFEVTVTGFDRNRDLFLQARKSGEAAAGRKLHNECVMI